MNINISGGDVISKLAMVFQVLFPLYAIAFALVLLPEIPRLLKNIFHGPKNAKEGPAQKAYRVWRDFGRKTYLGLRVGNQYIPNARVQQNKDGSAWVYTKAKGYVLIPKEKKPWVKQSPGGSGAFVYIPPKSKRARMPIWTSSDTPVRSSVPKISTSKSSGLPDWLKEWSNKPLK